MGITVPLGQWFCVVIHLLLSPTEGVAELWIDGALAGRAAGLDTSPPFGVNYLVAGIAWSGAEQPPVTIYVDEVAL